MARKRLLGQQTRPYERGVDPLAFYATIRMKHRRVVLQRASATLLYRLAEVSFKFLITSAQYRNGLVTASAE